MTKKLVMIICSVCLLLLPITSKTEQKVKADNFLDVTAKSCYVCDADSGTLIYSKNEKERMPIASMTKIMLLLLAFENSNCGKIDFNKEIIVSQKASGMGGSQAYIEKDGKYIISDLIKSIIIASANDSSVAIAEHIFGSEENAVTAMNEKAKQLGLTNTLFSNCTGLMKATQYSCAKDVAIMLGELIKYPDYFKYSKIYLDKIVHPGGRETTLTNTNKLIKFYNGCDGGKTGFTNEAGFCLAATAKRGNTRIISVLINEPSSKERFKDCSKTFDFSFENFMNKTVLQKNEEFNVKVKTENGKKEYAKIGAQKNLNVFGLKNEKENIKIDFLPLKKIKAPLKMGDVVGKFSVYKDNILMDEVNAVSLENIDKLKFFDYVSMIINA